MQLLRFKSHLNLILFVFIDFISNSWGKDSTILYIITHSYSPFQLNIFYVSNKRIQIIS